MLHSLQGILDGEEDFPGQRILSTGSHDTNSPDHLRQQFLDAVSCLATAVNNFLIMYAKAFRVDFTVNMTTDPTNGNILTLVLKILLNVSSLKTTPFL